MSKKVFVTAIQSISALGCEQSAVWSNYLKGQPHFSKIGFGEERSTGDWASKLDEACEQELQQLKGKRSQYQRLDRTVLMAMLAAEKALDQFPGGRSDMGLSLGSSRGATGVWERNHREFIIKKEVSAYSSPTTTLGNISVWTAQHLGLNGPAIDHSITCSTGLHAILNGMAWIRSGMSGQFMAGGTEAALTAFTLAQIKALRLYSHLDNLRACESMRFEKKSNSMVLGEAAAVAVLEGENSSRPLVQIRGIGYASEPLGSLSAISADALCLQRSMAGALRSAGLEKVDVLVMHAPGTVKGDMAEKKAVNEIFGKNLPLLTSNKWQLGHTFAASGMLSLEMGTLMISNNQFIENPFYANRRHLPKTIETVMINAVGFGGNAVSIIISKP